MASLGGALAALAGLILAPPSARAEAPTLEPAEVRLEITAPRPGEVVRNRVTMAAVRGRAFSGSGERVDFDVMVVIDISHSTRYPSGIDVDGDGEVGMNPKQELVLPGAYPEDMVCSDAEDTILAAEVLAARQLLGILDSERTRVGIISFSGEVDPESGERLSAQQRDAVVRVPLTRDFARIEAALVEILEQGPGGATNFAAAIQLSVVELAGLSGARSEPRRGSRKVVAFLTDGVPTFPFGKASESDPEDVEAAIAAARLARKAGIEVNGFALGQGALGAPLALSELCRISRGRFTPVRNPGDIVALLQGISFAGIEDVIVTNLDSGEISYDVELAPDGSFLAFIPVREGSNRVEVAALGDDGGEQRLRFELEFEKSGLTARELEIELERVKRRNRYLMRLIEKERIEAFRERQRRRVRVGVDGSGADGAEGSEQGAE
ncbi:MAG: VWA domain-containing protein [Myxococcota bacterium]|nr:VWA domain-containing protein [Myxococcota bacterium]